MQTVYVASRSAHEAAAVRRDLAAASEALGVALPSSGQVVVRPAIPWAHPRFAPNSSTDPALVEGVISALPGVSATIGAQSLPGFPTRYSLGRTRYAEVAKRGSARLVAFDEARFAAVPSLLAPDGAQLSLPAVWRDATFRIDAPRLMGSTFLPFSGALGHLYSLLPHDAQLELHHFIPDILARLAVAARPDLILVDAVQATHRGGELSGQPVDLGLLIVGTDPFAVDLVCAAAYGVPPEEMAPLVAAAPAGAAKSLADIRIVGDCTVADIESRAGQVERMNPNPEAFELPSKVRVLRSPRSRLNGSAGTLTEVFAILRLAGIQLSKSRPVTFVLGPVDDIPKGAGEYSTVMFVGDTARGEAADYSRVVRLTGRNVPVSRALMDVPYAMNIANLRTELGFGFTFAGMLAGVARLTGGRGTPRAASGPSEPKGGADQTTQHGT